VSKSPNRLLGIVLGFVFMVMGMLGFFLTSGTAFSGTMGPKLIDLFEINPLQNLLHLVTGIALLLAALIDLRLSRVINALAGAAYFLLGGVGLLIASSDNPFNIVAFNGADTVLNFAFAVVLLVVGLGADRSVRAATTA
jgi:hypothetical protein